MTRLLRNLLLAAVYVVVTAGMAAAVLDRALDATRSIPVADGFDFPVGDPASGDGYPMMTAFCASGGSHGHHLGEDIHVVDVPVRAAASGRVVVARFSGDWDGVVLLEHRLRDGGTVLTEYGHLQSIAVSAGQNVARGTQIGVSGPPGDDAPEAKHLHFEVKTLAAIGAGWDGGSSCPPHGFVDPASFVRASRPAG